MLTIHFIYLVEFDSNSNDLNESNVNIFPEAPTRRNSTQEDELLNVEQAVSIENNLSGNYRLLFPMLTLWPFVIFREC